MKTKARELILALDQGSSSSRVLAFDTRGYICAEASVPIKTRHRDGGRVEYSARQLVRSMKNSLDAVLSKLAPADRIVAAGLAVQRSTVVFFDRETLAPVTVAPSWMDGRAAAQVAHMQAHQKDIHAATGLYATPYYSAPKIRWFLDHDESVRSACRSQRLMCAPLSVYLTASLTAERTVAVDETNAQRTLLMGLTDRRWDSRMLERFSLSQDLLPPIKPVVGDWGWIKRGRWRFPLLAVVGDQQAAVIGMGADTAETCAINYGSGAFALRNIGAIPQSVDGLLCTVGVDRRGAKTHFLEGTVNSAGTTMEWLSRLGLISSAADISRAFRRSRRRVWALPALGGLGAPRWDFTATSSWVGLESQTTREDMARAMAEGVCHLVADIFDAMGAPVPASGPRVSGGLSKSSEMMAFQADVLGVPVSVARETESTALGAAALAAGRIGLEISDLLATTPKKVIYPRIAVAQRATLRSQWAFLVSACQRLSREMSLS